MAGCARVELLLGRIDAGRARLEDALARRPDEAGQLWLDLALRNAFYAGDTARMRDAAQHAVDAGLQAAGLAALALAESGAGPIPDAQAHCSQAADLIDAMSDDDLTRSLDGLTHLCGAEYCLDRSMRQWWACAPRDRPRGSLQWA